MTTLIVLSVVDIVLLIAGLAFYLFVVGGQLSRIATNLEECSELVRTIDRNAEVIVPGVEQINHTGGVVAGALPLLYGMAEGIVVGATYQPAATAERAGPARLRATPVPPARRRRLLAQRIGASGPPSAAASLARPVLVSGSHLRSAIADERVQGVGRRGVRGSPGRGPW